MEYEFEKTDVKTIENKKNEQEVQHEKIYQRRA